jgi:hypothetical protein
MYLGFWLENLKSRHFLGTLGKIILKPVLKSRVRGYKVDLSGPE